VWGEGVRVDRGRVKVMGRGQEGGSGGWGEERGEGSGEWRVESGEWRVESGEWGVGSGGRREDAGKGKGKGKDARREGMSWQ
jgi:hypothetical protein